MNKKVIVTIKSKQKADDEDEKVELITTGMYRKSEDGYYVVYDETEISGMEGTTTTVKINSDEVKLIRSGTTNAKMNFKKGIRDISLYSTPYGVLELIINPFLIDINVNDSGGEIRMIYGLETGGLKTSTNELYIKIQEGCN